MSDHYCCKRCGQRYDCCVCNQPPKPLSTDVVPNVKIGRIEFTPHHLTEADFRRIIREELERARLDAIPKDRCPR